MTGSSDDTSPVTPDGLTPGAAMVALCRTATVVRGHVEREVLQPQRLTWIAFEVLQFPLAHPRIRLHELAALTGAPKGTLVATVRVLDERRLIVRHTPKDRRQLELQATGEGRRATGEVAGQIAGIEGRLMPDPQPGRSFRTYTCLWASRSTAPPVTPATCCQRRSSCSSKCFVEVAQPTMTRQRSPELYDVPLLRFGTPL